MSARRARLALALVLAGLPAGAAPPAPAAETAQVRAPVFAGQFYPAAPGALRRAIDAFLADALPPSGERPVALVLPHAGYVYSGQIAADGYREAAGFDYELVVLLGTNHTTAPFAGIALDPVSGYRTPLGLVEADRELAAALAAADRAVSFRPEVFAREHSIEVQLPFVQALFPRARVLAAVVGAPELALARRFGATLAGHLAGRRALVVASSDLSHYPTLETAHTVDRATLAAIAALDPEVAAATIERAEASAAPGLATAACGRGPILVAMETARRLGARRGRVVSAATSGDTVAGEAGRVVGYGAVAFSEGAVGTAAEALSAPPATVPPPADATPLSASDRAALLALARATLTRSYDTGTLPLPRPASPRLARAQGAFVTLLEGGELRGCIGHLASDTPLALTVARMALAAATEDPRFPPVRAEELDRLVVEISVLTPFTPVAGPAAIVAGRDGVLLRQAGRQAVFLPQVASEQGWGRDELLDHLCEKAGLAASCWRRDVQLATFQADVFRESRTP